MCCELKGEQELRLRKVPKVQDSILTRPLPKGTVPFGLPRCSDLKTKFASPFTLGLLLATT